MSLNVIQILLLDGKILCVNYKDIINRVLIKHICKYLNLQRPDTVGLLYKDSRGYFQWLDDSKTIFDHDIDLDHEFIQLIFRIRYVPHHVCYNESNIYQLFLLSVRLLKQKWFITRTEIHSQLIALYILFKHGNNLNALEIENAISESKLLIYDPISNDSLLNTIIDAFNEYKLKFNTSVGFLLKFLHLALSFPIVNSKLYVVSDSKSQNFVLGINSLELTFFYLDQFQNPFRRFKFSHIENVMRRRIKIVLDLKCDKKRSVTPTNFLSENEMATFYALSPHQSECIYEEIKACQKQFCESKSIYKISELMKNSKFNEIFDKWLRKQYSCKFTEFEENYNNDGIKMFVEVDADKKDVEAEFGEMSLFESDIYLRLNQEKEINVGIYKKSDFQQLVSEDSRLKELLHLKLIQLQELFIEEEKITGSMPAEVLMHFPNGIQKFQRNIRNSNLSYQGRGCAASVRNKLMVIATENLKSNEKTLSSSRSVNDLTTLKNSSFSKTKSDSSSFRSIEDSKSNVVHKSSGNLFFNGSRSISSTQKYKPKSISQNNNSSSNLQLKSIFYSSTTDNKHSPSSPKSDVFLSHSSNTIPSTHSSPLIHQFKQQSSNKPVYNRSYERKK